ncbi:MAG: uncharacterized protein JWR26_492 [Pedosphaera sp.]|nr:uncharacterized protein [Pedosphaera sp.]
MNFIHSQRDFEDVLGSARAIVFIFSEWSEQSARSREAVEQWEREAQTDGLKCEIHGLVPDGHPYTWKWLATHLDGVGSIEHGTGPVLWLIKGSVVGRVPSAASVETKTLARITRECFVAGKILTTAAAISLHAESHPFDVELLKILCCPETHQELALATSAAVEKLNREIGAGSLQNRAGRQVEETLDGGLVRADGKYLYPMRQSIPVLLVDEAIPLRIGLTH